MSSSSRRARRMDPARVPPELHEFIPLFELYGVVVGDAARRGLEDSIRADPERLAELADFARRFTVETQEIFDDWLGRAEPA